jgi:hypothetical protein
MDFMAPPFEAENYQNLGRLTTLLRPTSGGFGRNVGGFIVELIAIRESHLRSSVTIRS